jgi:hypothetical protein
MGLSSKAAAGPPFNSRCPEEPGQQPCCAAHKLVVMFRGWMGMHGYLHHSTFWVEGSQAMDGSLLPVSAAVL